MKIFNLISEKYSLLTFSLTPLIYIHKIIQLCASLQVTQFAVIIYFQHFFEVPKGRRQKF